VEGGYVGKSNNGLTRSAARCDPVRTDVGARRAGARASSVARVSRTDRTAGVAGIGSRAQAAQ